MALLSAAGRQLALGILNRRFAVQLANNGISKPQVATLIAEVDAYCDGMDGARPATSLRAACSAPFAGALQSQVEARLVVTAVVQALRAKEAGIDLLRIGGGE